MSQFIDTVKGTVNTAVDSLSTVAQNFIEKNRTKAKLNRLRMVMKNESELMNRAYIALGKEFYEALKKGEVPSTEKQQKLVNVVDGSKAKIARARDCYREVLEASQDDFIYAAPKEEEDYSKDDVIDITVACSNEDDYSSSPFENAADAVKDNVGNAARSVKENVEGAVEATKEKLSAAKENVEGAVEKAKVNVEGAVEKAKENVETAKVNVEGAVEKAKENVEGAVEATKEKLSAAKDKIQNTVDGALDSLNDDEADDGELF